jgi:hypothetical protein
LLDAVELSGSRLIEVGDPAQSQPVGAGGLWPHLERATRRAGARVGLTRNQRAQDPDDRRDQALFRAGEHARAIRSYAAREHVHLRADPSRAEDLVLDAAEADRGAGKTTIVIAETSNEHLDALNARTQAIRKQRGELGRESVPIPGRPYELHRGDEVQVRRAINCPDHRRIANGTIASVAGVDPTGRRVILDIRGKDRITLDEFQIAHGDLRLAYVQHPFPAQGQTTNTAHVLVSDYSSAEGSYVAITRAREQTDIYAGIGPAERSVDSDRLQLLVDRMSRTEPEVPSIDVPLRHEATITLQPQEGDHKVSHPMRVSNEQATIVEQVESAGESNPPELVPSAARRSERAVPAESAVPEHGSEPAETAHTGGRRRHWQPRRQEGARREALEADHEAESTERTDSWGWEP